MGWYSVRGWTIRKVRQFVCTCKQVHVIICLINCFVLTNANHVLYGYPNWHLTALNLHNSVHGITLLQPTAPFFSQHQSNISQAQQFINPFPPIIVTIDPTANFTYDHLKGIQTATSVVCLYIASDSVDLPINVSIESSDEPTFDVPSGVTPLGVTLMNENRIILFPKYIVGVDIFMVTVHELLHVLGYGIPDWFNHLLQLNNNVVYNGSLMVDFTHTLLPVDKHSLTHWSGEVELSSGKNADIMEPYLHKDTKLSAESLTVIQQLHTNWTSIACRSSRDCALLHRHTKLKNQTFVCHYFAKDMPGICVFDEFCHFHKCLPVYKATPSMTDRNKIISNIISFLFTGILLKTRMLYSENGH